MNIFQLLLRQKALHGACPSKAVARTYLKKPIENAEKAVRVPSKSPHSVLEETLPLASCGFTTL